MMILTVYENATPGNPPHGHIDVPNEAGAILALGEINEERGYVCKFKLEEVGEDGWSCNECEEERK